ncbi:hypothetical protein Ddc_10576 [Ditylenchus destructor]|nr:hypothetical protein Ddc_10576 [Ditylenchus destructor]
MSHPEASGCLLDSGACAAKDYLCIILVSHLCAIFSPEKKVRFQFDQTVTKFRSMDYIWSFRDSLFYGICSCSGGANGVDTEPVPKHG